MTVRSQKQKTTHKKRMPRRDFLRSAAFLGGSGLLSGMVAPVFSRFGSCATHG